MIANLGFDRLSDISMFRRVSIRAAGKDIVTNYEKITD